jgi:hypothetical protein
VLPVIKMDNCASFHGFSLISHEQKLREDTYYPQERVDRLPYNPPVPKNSQLFPHAIGPERPLTNYSENDYATN